MADGKKQNLHTSTPAPNRKAAATKKLFGMSPTKPSFSPILKKMTMLDMVIKAIKVVGLPRKGASLPAIKKWILANGESTSRNPAAALKKAILKGIESGILSRPPHCIDVQGINGSFILASTSKKVKKAPKENMQKTEELLTENVKEQKLVHNKTEAINKGPKKNAKSEKKTVAKETKKNRVSLSKGITKKVAKKNPVASKINKKGTKKDIESPPKIIAKKGSKKKPLTSNVDKNKYIFTDSESEENVEQSDQDLEFAKQKVNQTEVLKKGKAIKTKEQPKIKDSVTKTKMEKDEKIVHQKKRKESDSNIKDVVKQSKTNREPLGKYKSKTKTKEVANNLRDLDVTRKDMSDTELDTRPNRPKSIKSYASDTELEISRRKSHQIKKIKRERKVLSKNVHKNANGTETSSEKEMDNTKTAKSQSNLKK